MKYRLTLPDGYSPSWWRDGDPRSFIIEDGKNEYDYDLRTDGLPRDFIERVYECSACIKTSVAMAVGTFDKYLEVCDKAMSLPLGVSRYWIFEHGATIEPI